MLSFIVRPLRLAASALLGSDSPRQLAAGFALGLVLGLVPKGNLIALSLCVLIFSLRVNTSLALVAAVAFSCAGSILDPLTAKLGLQVLTVNSMQATYASVFNLPLGPWLGFNNTIVMGSLLMGLYLMYPAYWVALVISERVQPRLVAQAKDRDRLASRASVPAPATRRAA